jgi:hypothetical protein
MTFGWTKHSNPSDARKRKGLDSSLFCRKWCREMKRVDAAERRVAELQALMRADIEHPYKREDAP